MLSITRRISEYNHYNENSIDYLVVHDTGNYKDSAAANANYFNGGNRGSSAHYFVDDISTYQVVEDYNGAWHVGDGHGKYGITNTNSIGIEMCNSGGYISEKTINNTLELVRYLMSKYNIPINRVVRHYDASRKICPNNMAANNWAKWNEFKSRIQGKSLNTGQQARTGNNQTWDDSVRDKKAKIVNIQSYLNVRYTPGGKVIGSLKNGQEITLWRLEGDWYHIYSPVSGYNQAYVHKNYVQISQSNSTFTDTNLDGKVGYINTPSGVNVREQKSTSSKILGALPNGAKVQLYRKEGDWMHIYYPPHGGYVYKKYVKY